MMFLHVGRKADFRCGCSLPTVRDEEQTFGAISQHSFLAVLRPLARIPQKASKMVDIFVCHNVKIDIEFIGNELCM